MAQRNSGNSLGLTQAARSAGLSKRRWNLALDHRACAVRMGMRQLAPSGLLHGEVEDRQEDVDDLVGDEQPAQHGGGHGPDDLGTDPGGPQHGRDREDRRAFGEELGPEPVHGTLEDRLTEIRDRRDSCQAAAFLDRLSEVDEHDDAGLYRHAEAGDVADPDGHAERETEEPLEDRPAGQG
jgi:hypothetical protein